MFGETGMKRTGLAAHKEEAGLVLCDEKGKERAKLTAAKDGPRLSMFDENGQERAGTAVGKDGPELRFLARRTRPGCVWARSRTGRRCNCLTRTAARG